MNKKQLVALREEVLDALDDRVASGDFDANAKHMRLLLSNMTCLIDHAISQLPKPTKK